VLTSIDKKILKALLETNGKVTSDNLAKKLKLPRATVQRRKQDLEKRFLKFTYTLNIEEMGFRRLDFFIFINNGKTSSVAQKLLKMDEVVEVGRSLGTHTIHLKAEAIIKDNKELTDLIESIKIMEGVMEVKWVEIVKVVGRKKPISAIISKM
jgi:DNA-binding Lrp family transcriptional regulator